MERSEIAASLIRGRIIAIVRAPTGREAVATGQSLMEAGMPAVEVALTTPGGIEAVAALAEASSGCLVGAGTVLDSASARLAVLAGARFLVSPALSAEVMRTAHRYGVAVVPGAATPTEVIATLEAGADLTKLFPASELGVGYLKAIRAAIPQAALVPTGGVDATNARSWLEAGAVAVGVGGALTRGSESEVQARAKELLEAVSL